MTADPALPPAPSTDNWLERRVRLTPRCRALVSDAGTLTYAELADEARRRAAVLVAALARPPSAEDARDGATRAGSGPSRVALLAGNCAEYVLWLVAAQAVGVQTVPLNARLAVPELAEQIADCRPALLLCDGDRLDAARRAAAAAGPSDLQVARFEDARNWPACGENELEAAWLASYDLRRVAGIMYTSGSTGRPKGVVQTLGNHWHSAVNCCLNLGFSAESDLWGCPVPLFHMSGLSIVMRSLALGVGVRLYDRFDPCAVNDDVLAGRVTCLSAVTYQIERMLDDLDGRPGTSVYPDSLRFVLQGGGPLPTATLRRCAQARMPAVQSFGMTETASQVVSLSAREALRRPGSAGRPLASVQLRIADRQGASDDSLPAGVEGRILLKSPTLAVAYLNQPERYQASFTAHGWFDTGDLGHVDEDGYLYVACRRSDLIVSGGENVYPAEVEQAVARHPLVDRVVVAGAADRLWGSVPVAVCVPVPGAAADELPGDDELRAFCRRFLAPYKCPRHTVWVDELPLTASGKPKRAEAARLAEAALARRTG